MKPLTKAQYAARALELAMALNETKADRDDYERRWLAECREHGETKRRLMLAHHELGEHSLCS